MKTIWKYELDIATEQSINIPCPAKLLKVAEQNKVLCVWMEVDTTNKKELQKFYIRGTGEPFTEYENRYCGSVVMSYGLVWHVYT